ncbi:hypothetical protein MMC26_004693 [Xylographa opegraphella]|nr:hypothetical protein [Xylographa opegraphella]
MPTVAIPAAVPAASITHRYRTTPVLPVNTQCEWVPRFPPRQPGPPHLHMGRVQITPSDTPSLPLPCLRSSAVYDSFGSAQLTLSSCPEPYLPIFVTRDLLVMRLLPRIRSASSRRSDEASSLANTTPTPRTIQIPSPAQPLPPSSPLPAPAPAPPPSPPQRS